MFTVYDLASEMTPTRFCAPIIRFRVKSDGASWMIVRVSVKGSHFEVLFSQYLFN